MKGTLYAVGVGPGDPELLTLKAVKTLQFVDIIACPSKEGAPGHAFHIAEQAVPEIIRKELLLLHFPMSSVGISDAHQLAAEAIQNKLNAGMNVAFLTLSDPGFYSTFSYILGIVAQNGYEVKTVSGVPSFCAASARLNLSLAHGEESVLISSGEFHNFSGTQVILKAGKHLKTLKQTLSSTGKTAYLIENCGMENERIYVGADSFPDETGYLSILIIM